MKCSNCGKEITGNDKFCMYCGAEIKNTISQNQTQYTEPKHKDPSMPNLSDDEYEIASYLCSRLKFPKCEGRVTVTNKRLVFHGAGRSFFNNRIVQEVEIQEVRGLSSYYGLNIYWGKLFFGILLTLMGIGMFSTMSQSYSYYGGSSSSDPLMFLVLAVGIYLIVSAFRKAYFLTVYTRAMSAGIEIGNGANTLVGNSAAFAIVGEPNRETDKMMKELGALVMEIQKYGEN